MALVMLNFILTKDRIGKIVTLNHSNMSNLNRKSKPSNATGVSERYLHIIIIEAEWLR